MEQGSSVALADDECYRVYAEVDECYTCRMPQGCLGGNLCAKGYSNDAKAGSECAVGYYELLDECHVCPDNALLTVVVLAVGFFALAVAV